MWSNGQDTQGERALTRTEPHFAVNKPVSPETNKGVLEGHRNPCGEGQSHATSHMQGTVMPTYPLPYTKKGKWRYSGCMQHWLMRRTLSQKMRCIHGYVLPHYANRVPR